MNKKMTTLLILSIFTCFLLFAIEAVALPLPTSFIKTPSYDIDKLNDAGNWTKNYYNDLDNDNLWDMNEPWADSALAGWTNPQWADDNSCWLASSANMLAAQGYDLGNVQGIYDELVNNFGWTEGGWQHEALDWYIFQHEGPSPSYRVNWYGVYTGTSTTHSQITTSNPWPQNPYDFVKNELYRCQQVGIVLHTQSLYHAVTFYGWDNITPFSIITDSDTDTDHYSTTDRNYYKTWSSPTEWKIDYSTYDQIDVPIDYFATLCPIPEPSTMLLFGIGIACLIGMRFRKRR